MTADLPPVDDDALTPPTFDVLPLSAEVRAALDSMGYRNPTPVQRAVFEPATAGKDLVVQARTGTGKTTAFGLPIVERGVRRDVKAAQVLCLCPTRELALQVEAEVRKLGQNRAIETIAIYGGAPMGKQIDGLAAGAQVVVGTPGRVLDHLKRGTFDATNIRMLVLDEADEMLSMGFERELSEILSRLPTTRQTLLFSATLPPDIERMARERLKQPEFVTLSGDHVGALSIQHFVYLITEDKVGALIRVIETENPEGAVIFCNTKVETEAVSAALSRAGYDADWLNGDLAQNEREHVMGRIREGKLRFLVATDVAARGIDISHLTHVINYDFPDQAESYVHRTGRTGRAGRTGTAISLVRAQDIGNLYLLRLTYQIRPIERQLPTAGELRTRRDADLVQMVIDSFAARAVHPEDLLLARRLLTHDDAERMVASLLRTYLGERQPSEDAAAAARRAKAPRPPPKARANDPRPAEGENRTEGPRPTNGPGPRRDRDASDRDRRPRDRDRPVATPLPTTNTSTNTSTNAVAAPTAPAVGSAPQARPAAATAVPPVSAPSDKSLASDATRTTVVSAIPTASDVPRDRGIGAATPPASTTSTDSQSYRSGQEPRRPRTRPAAPTNAEPVRYFIGEEGPATALSPEASAPPHAVRNRLIDWHPPEEDGDDAPIFRGSKPASEIAPPTIATVTPSIATQPVSVAAAPAQTPAQTVSAPAPVADEGYGEGSDNPRDYSEIFVDVGRREGVRPADLQRVLRDKGGISRRETGRIRVRDKHTFVSVRKDVFDKALVALTGIEIGGRTSRAEAARSEPVPGGTEG